MNDRQTLIKIIIENEPQMVYFISKQDFKRLLCNQAIKAMFPDKSNQIIINPTKKNDYIKILETVLTQKNQVITICYNHLNLWDNRKDAIAFFKEGALSCEGSEQDRYISVISDLMSNEIICTD